VIRECNKIEKNSECRHLRVKRKREKKIERVRDLERKKNIQRERERLLYIIEIQDKCGCSRVCQLSIVLA